MCTAEGHRITQQRLSSSALCPVAAAQQQIGPLQHLPAAFRLLPKILVLRIAAEKASHFTDTQQPTESNKQYVVSWFNFPHASTRYSVNPPPPRQPFYVSTHSNKIIQVVKVL